MKAARTYSRSGSQATLYRQSCSDGDRYSVLLIAGQYSVLVYHGPRREKARSAWRRAKRMVRSD